MELQEKSKSMENEDERIASTATSNTSSLQSREHSLGLKYLNQYLYFNEYIFMNKSENTENNDNTNANRFKIILIKDNNLNLKICKSFSSFTFFTESETRESLINDIPEETNEENILDMLNIASISATNAFEYSFAQPNMNIHWAGPSHWTYNDSIRKIVETDKNYEQASVQKRKQKIELLYNDNRNVINAKFASSRSNIYTEKIFLKWKAEDITFPRDVHYNIEQMYKFYLMPTRNLKSNEYNANDIFEYCPDINNNHAMDEEYNTNNIFEYCPDINNQDADDHRDNEEENPSISRNNFDNNLVSPSHILTKDKIISINKLKRAMWNCISNNDEERTSSTQKRKKKFSDIHKTLIKTLPESETKALNASSAFNALLHLANEKNFKLQSATDNSDVIIQSDDESD